MNPCTNAGDIKRGGFDPWVKKIPRGGPGDPLQFSCLENPTNRGAWWATVLWVTGTAVVTSCTRVCMRVSLVVRMVKNLPAVQETALIPGSGRSSRVGNGNPLQCSCLENLVDRRAWWATAHRVTESWTDWATDGADVYACQPSQSAPASPILRSTCPDSRNRDFIGYFIWPIKLFFKVFWISMLCSGFWAIISN